MTAQSSNGVCQTEICRRCTAAAGASVLSILATTPLDVVKTRMQAQAAPPIASESFVQRFAFAGCPNMCHGTTLSQTRWAALCPPQCYVYLSTLDAMKKITRQEGIRVLWRGTRESLLMAVPLVGLYLPLYDSLMQRTGSLGAAAPVVSGTIARTISIFCVTPIEVLRVRLQLIRQNNTQGAVHYSNLNAFDWGQGKGPLHKARALWKGFGATMLRDVPFTAIYWGTLEPLRQSLMPMAFVKDCVCRQRLLPRSGDPSLTETLLANSTAGALSGVLSAIATHPMDVVKTRIQIAQNAGSALPSNLLGVYQQIYNTEGLRGLFSGVVPRTLRTGPSSAIVISGYELLKRLL